MVDCGDRIRNSSLRLELAQTIAQLRCEGEAIFVHSRSAVGQQRHQRNGSQQPETRFAQFHGHALGQPLQPVQGGQKKKYVASANATSEIRTAKTFIFSSHHAAKLPDDTPLAILLFQRIIAILYSHWTVEDANIEQCLVMRSIETHP